MEVVTSDKQEAQMEKMYHSETSNSDSIQKFEEQDTVGTFNLQFKRDINQNLTHRSKETAETLKLPSSKKFRMDYTM
jgi:hypothetical protein